MGGDDVAYRMVARVSLHQVMPLFARSPFRIDGEVHRNHTMMV